MTSPKINAIAPWYGSNRTLAENVGRALGTVAWVAIPFAGSMTELRFIKARSIMVNDKHKDLINLARVMGDRKLGPMLYRRLRRHIFHPDDLRDAQRSTEPFRRAAAAFDLVDDNYPTDMCIAWAEAYFVCVWMGRSAKAGTKDELKGKPAVRWESSGGDSVVRYQNAVGSIPAWRRMLSRCQFSTLDVFELLRKCKDDRNTGIYCDPPFPGPGDKYLHTFDEEDHRRLSIDLSLFVNARIVCRFYDDELIRFLYPDNVWQWAHLDGGRDQANTKNKPEVLITRNMP